MASLSEPRRIAQAMTSIGRKSIPWKSSSSSRRPSKTSKTTDWNAKRTTRHANYFKVVAAMQLFRPIKRVRKSLFERFPSLFHAQVERWPIYRERAKEQLVIQFNIYIYLCSLPFLLMRWWLIARGLILVNAHISHNRSSGLETSLASGAGDLKSKRKAT